MTDQILDAIIYQGRECPILAIGGMGLLTPADFGMKAREISTACHRGYYMRYLCDEATLFLNEMTIRTEDDIYPEIEGVHPFRAIRELWSAMTYLGLRAATPFTGGLLIGTDIRRGSGGRLSLGYWRSYTPILEILFEGGRLRKEMDCSDQIAQLPTAIQANDLEGIFSLKYDFFYPLTLARVRR